MSDSVLHISYHWDKDKHMCFYLEKSRGGAKQPFIAKTPQTVDKHRRRQTAE